MEKLARPARTDTFEHTITGLLTKRADLYNEAERIRDRLAEIRNDIDALDRVLGTLGYEGELDAAMPRQKRQVLFGKGELTTAILRQLRLADGPMTCREIANAIVAMNGMDGRDRRYMKEVSDRVSKAIRAQRERGVVMIGASDPGPISYLLNTSGRGTSEGQ